MKKLLFILVLSTSIVSAQWVQKTSCNKKAAQISNQAIESMANLEYLTALGMAKAALIIDSDCGCAQLVAQIQIGEDKKLNLKQLMFLN